jgi:hypothetical protein
MQDLEIPKTAPGDRILLCPPAGQGPPVPAVSIAAAMTEAARLHGAGGRWRRAPDSPVRPVPRGAPVVFQYLTSSIALKGEDSLHTADRSQHSARAAWTGWAVHWHRDRVPPRPEQVMVV